MHKSIYKKAKMFSSPSFLRTPCVGMEVSDGSIKFVKLILTKKGIKVEKYGEKKIPRGIIESGKIVDSLRLEEIIMELKNEYKIKDVRISVLEDQIYLFKLILKRDDLKNVKESIEFVLEEHIPIPASETIFDYEIIKEDDEEFLVQVTAIQKDIVYDYLSVFEKCDISVHAIEPEGQAIGRAIIKKGDLSTNMIVDVGQERTSIFIISKGRMLFSSTLDFNSDMLTKMLEEHLHISYEEAENIKIKYGLQKNIEDKEIFPILLNGVSILRDEILKNFFYWHSHEDEFGSKNPQIDKILFCGGTSSMINLDEYFSISMKIKIEIANIWTNILNEKEMVPEVDFQGTLSLITAFGLALGNFEND